MGLLYNIIRNDQKTKKKERKKERKEKKKKKKTPISVDEVCTEYV